MKGTKIIEIVVSVVVIFTLLGALGGLLLTSAGNAASSGLPLASQFFSPNGIVLTLVVLGIAIGLIYYAIHAASGKGGKGGI